MQELFRLTQKRIKGTYSYIIKLYDKPKKEFIPAEFIPVPDISSWVSVVNIILLLSLFLETKIPWFLAVSLFLLSQALLKQENNKIY